MNAPNDDDVLASFLSAEIARPDDNDGQDEMRDRLAASLGIPMPTPPVAEVIARRVLSAASRWKALALLAVGFGAGFTTHAVLPARAPSAAPAVPLSAPSVVASSLAPAVASESAATQAVDPSTLPLVDAPTASTLAAKSASAANATAGVGDVEAERLLLETARAAMRRGDAPGALRLLKEHKSRFPRGQLKEERDGMTVSALGMLGRTEEAEKAAARFKKDYPMSLQGAALPHDAGL